MARRVGIQIAELPIKVRERALTGTETCLRDAGSELGIAGQQLESLVDLQMKAIRQVVADLDNETWRHESAKAKRWPVSASARPNVAAKGTRSKLA
jgi:hypothetical protein